MHVQPVDAVGVLECEDTLDNAVDVKEILTEDVASITTVTSSKLEGSVTWNNPVVTGPTTGGFMQSRWIIHHQRD